MHFSTTTLLSLSAAALATAQQTTASADTPATACASASMVSNNIPQPSGAPEINACPSSIPLGGNCGADAQCMDGAQCFGSTAFTIRRCGNFNAACDSNAQCAFNSCNNGLCNGFLSSSSIGSATATQAGHVGSTGYPAPGYGNATQPHATGSGAAYPSGTSVPQQPVGNGAQRTWVSGGIIVAVAGFGALLL